MDKYMMGLQLLIIGMGTVIIALFLLSLFLRASGSFFGPEKKEEVSNDTGGNKMQTANKTTEVEQQGLTPAKKAAVSAALYQVLDKNKYRIISIRRSNDSNWVN